MKKSVAGFSLAGALLFEAHFQLYGTKFSANKFKNNEKIPYLK
jgi:hypothetical protein